MDDFRESRFRVQLERALEGVRLLLENERNPQAPGDVQHSYADKYILVEHVTNTCLASWLNILEVLGLASESLAQLQEWATTRSVTLSFTSEESCKFLKKATRTIEPNSERVHEYGSSSGITAKLTSKTVTKVTEWFWQYEFKYTLEAYMGPSSSKERIVLREGSGSCELITNADATPKPEKKVNPDLTVPLTWFLQNISKESVLSFAIDRSSRECHTPRRNIDAEKALGFCQSASAWGKSVKQYFTTVFAVQPHQEKLDTSALRAPGLFSPVVPLFEARAHEQKTAEKGELLASLPDDSKEQSPALPYHDTNKFLARQKESIAAFNVRLEKTLPTEGLTTPTNGLVSVVCWHASDLAENLIDAINYVENMLKEQVISAIGKVLTPIDFTEYMSFHYRKLFQDAFAPVPFSHAVRRPAHSPEGTISVEAQQADGTMADPVFTIFRHSEGAAPMQFPINAATNVTFGGDRYLHAYVRHTFSGSSASSLHLVARARQFSCFVLMVGRIASAKVFEPKHAIIIQNKDDLLIPLLLEQIPTPKEFRDAIESLSPEQQRFAKAFRAMQLESTLFGVCVLQIKPQLEKLLNLPDDSLTKEIRLTQDLLELFIKYQIPSDLLSYDGEGPCSVSGKVAVVKGFVAAMYEMINTKKISELKEISAEALFSEAATFGGAPPSQLPKTAVSYSAPLRSLAPMAPQMVYGAPPPATNADYARAPTGACPPPMPYAPRSAPAPTPPMTPFSTPVPVPVPAAVPAPKPAPAPPQPSKPQVAQPQPAKLEDAEPQLSDGAEPGVENDGGEDFTLIPAKLDRKFELLDEDAAVRPTIIKVAGTWKKTSLASLLAAPVTTSLTKDDLKKEKNQAFDLLDALSKSGSLHIDQASLHVVMAATHCFDKTLLETLVKDNVNPIEKVERSALILATTIHDLPAEELVRPSQIEASKRASPGLFSA